MNDWLTRVADLLADGPVAVVTVLMAEGSTPREAGARMLVTHDAIEGTIGGGALEYQAIADARAMLAEGAPWLRRIIDVPLGPALQQCCGGYVRLLVEVIAQDQRAALAEIAGTPGLLIRPAASGAGWIAVAHRKAVGRLPLPVAKAARGMLSGAECCEPVVVDVADVPWLVEPIQQPSTPLYLYGAGHVAREVVSVLAGLPFRITWVDVARSRFPERTEKAIDVVVSDDPAAAALGAPAGAVHVVMSFSHALDEAICTALLEANTFAYLGLIGSETKRARFVQRFRRAGISEAAIARLTCPIGLREVPGKMPRAIAIALAAQLVALSPAHGTQSNPRLTTIPRTTKGTS